MRLRDRPIAQPDAEARPSPGASATARSTSIARKGTGARVEAMTMLDLLLKPELVRQA